MSDAEYICLFIATSCLVIIAIIFLAISTKSKKSCFSYVCFFIGFTIVMSEILPALYALFVEIPDWLSYLRPWSWPVGQALSVLYWLVFLTAMMSQRWKGKNNVADKVHLMFHSHIVFNTLIILYVVSFFSIIAIPQEEVEAGYTAANWVLKPELRGASTAWQGILRPFGSIFYPLVAVILFFIIQKVRTSRHLTTTNILVSLIAISMTFVKLVFDLSSGGRGTILIIGLSILAVIWIHFGKKKAFIGFTVLGAIGILISPFLLIYRDNPTAYVNMDINSRLNSFLSIVAEEHGVSWIDEISKVVLRFDNVPHGGNLALYTAETNHVYFTPYLGSIAGWIPRTLWPDKPYPRSGDGTASATPHWKSGQISERPWLSTSVSTPGIAFWHFNLLGVILTAIIHVYLIKIIVALGDNLKRPELFLLLWLIIKPIEPLDAIILYIMQWIVPILILFWLVRRVVPISATLTNKTTKPLTSFPR